MKTPCFEVMIFGPSKVSNGYAIVRGNKAKIVEHIEFPSKKYRLVDDLDSGLNGQKIALVCRSLSNGTRQVGPASSRLIL